HVARFRRAHHRGAVRPQPVRRERPVLDAADPHHAVLDHGHIAVAVVFVKADGDERGDRDRTFITRDGVTRQVAVHVVHDLPHLVVESLLGLDDGLWGELVAGVHAASDRAATARDPKRQKRGRIAAGAGAPTDEWLSEGHRRAKTLTNAVTNRWGDGPDTPAG